MNIIVCVKQVPDTTVVKIDPVKGTLIREGVPSIMNPDDKGGLELALRLKDQFGANVTVISMGPPQADVMLREALAMGADRAILLSDRKFAGADTLATSYALSGLCRVLDYDLIIAGRQAIDGDTAQVGPQISEHLGIPVISYAQKIVDIDEQARTITVERQFDDRYMVVKASLPCLVTALADLGENLYMTPGGIFDAVDADVTVWGRDDLKGVLDENIGLAGSPTQIAKASDKVRKGKGETVKDLGPAEAVDYIVGKLMEKHVI